MSDSTNYTGRVYNDPAYRIAKSMYIAIGGDASITFENTDEIYEAINGMYAESGGRIAIEPLNMLISSNGPYTFNDEDITGYKPVNIEVDVPQKWTDEQVSQIEKESWYEGHATGYNEGYNSGYSSGSVDGYTDGYAEGLDDGAEEQKSLLEPITITENGTYNREDGWNAVTVEVPTSGGGTGGGADGLDFESIGWDAAYSKEINNIYKAHLAYSASQIDKVNNGSFKGDTNLVFAPYAPYGGVVINLSNEFENCKNLQYVPLYDTSDVQFMSKMFYGCSALSTVPLFDTSKVSYMTDMFRGCSSLTTVPQFDTSSVIYMSGMFQECSSLTTVPQFDTSNANTMSYMFDGCSSLTTVLQFDTRNVTNMSYMFQKCSSLTTVPQFDTSSVTNISSMFNGCSSLTTVPPLDVSKVTSINLMFSGCTNLIDVGGLINLGMQSNLSAPTSKYSGIFYGCKYITRESVINIFNGLYDRSTAGYSNLKLLFEADVINRLTEEDIAIATNKGWTISQ